MQRTIAFPVLVATLTASAAHAQTCEITDLLAGDSQASEVTNHWNGSTFKTYLVRNNARSQDGILNNWIKFELIPQRWGFDLKFPNGKRFAQVNKEAGRWVVSVSPPAASPCNTHAVTLRKSQSGKMEVFDGAIRVGAIDRFPFDELF